mgnify:FL=1
MFRPASKLLAAALFSVSLAGQQTALPAAPARPDPQIPPITFRAEVNYVEVDAIVEDAQGNFVRDLGKADFQIFESDKLQTISAFAAVSIPVERAERPLFSTKEIPPDVRSNAAGPSGRIYVLLLDDMHTDPLRSTHVRRAAKQFITRNLGSNDLMAVLQTSGKLDASQDFTDNRQLLQNAVDKFMGRKLRSTVLNKMDEYNRLREIGLGNDPIKDADEQQRAYNARSMLSTLKNVSEFLAGVRGRRKALVLISEGIDYNIENWKDNSEAFAVRDETRDAIAAATRANVNIYSIDPRGLATMGDEIIQMSSQAPDMPFGATNLQNELRASQDTLRVLSDETGGFASVSSNDFGSAFERIVDENSSYYVLGYYPSNDKRDGRFRPIDVRVTRPGLKVRARRGYMAPTGKVPPPNTLNPTEGTSAELRNALNNPLQTTGLTMSVFAAPFRGAAPNASVVVVTQVRGSDMAFTEKDGKFLNTLEMSYLAINEQGKVAGGNRESLNMALKPDTYRQVMRTGFRMQSTFDLPPGKYTLKLAARESGGRAGSVHYDLIVPDFAKEPLTISGLAITSSSAGQVPTAGTLPDLRDMLPTPPTTSREFSARDELALVVEIYDNQAAVNHAVDITATLRSNEGHVVFTNNERRQSKELGGSRGGFGYTARIPLGELAPGLYLLRVEAKSSLGAGGLVGRDVQIRITP